MGTFLLLLFPEGRLPSPRWKPWAWLCAITIAVVSAISVVVPRTFADHDLPTVRNPLAIEALRPVAAALEWFVLVLVIAMLGCVVALIRRFRRSYARERLQLKWLALGAAISAGAYGLGIGIAGFLELTDRAVAPTWFTRSTSGRYRAARRGHHHDAAGACLAVAAEVLEGPSARSSECRNQG
jgi:hypothetical protein